MKDDNNNKNWFKSCNMLTSISGTIFMEFLEKFYKQFP